MSATTEMHLAAVAEGASAAAPAPAVEPPRARTGILSAAAAGDWMRLLIVLGLVLPSLYYAYYAWSSYRQEWDLAAERVEGASRIAAQHGSRVFETAELLVGRVRDLTGSAAYRPADEAAMHMLLKRMVGDMPHVQSVWIWNARGEPEASSRYYPKPPIDISDREHFQRLRAGEKSFITTALEGRVSGARLFSFNERLEGPNGEFLGVIGVSLHVDYFEAFYERLAKNQHGLAVSLIKQDGSMVLRNPSLPRGPAARVPADAPLATAMQLGQVEGRYRGIGPVGREERQVAFRALSPYPLYVVPSVDSSEVLAAWKQGLWRMAAVVFPVAAALVGVAWLAMRKSRGELLALGRLADEERRRAAAEGALRHSQHLEALGRLTGGVAHDFNNLLMVVNNQAYILKKKLAGTPSETHLLALERAVKTGERLTRQLLAFARRQPLRSERIELQVKLPQMQQMIRHSLSPEVKLIVNVDSDTQPVYVDSSELELALLNLAINARDAMPKGGVVTLLARNATPPEAPNPDVPYVVISLSDTGHGIPKQTLERVFEPFFTTKGVGGGAGLGLSQVEGFCVQSGGSVKIESAEQVGTTVRMFLPAARGDVQEVSNSDPQVRASGFGEHVLLVEDNEEVAQTTLALIRALGYHGHRVSNAKEALRYLGTGRSLDVVLSDVVMPGALSGIELAKLLKQRHPRLPVVLMSGYTQDLAQADKEAFQVLAKPVSPETLGAALATAVRPRHAPLAT